MVSSAVTAGLGTANGPRQCTSPGGGGVGGGGVGGGILFIHNEAGVLLHLRSSGER